MHFSHRRLSHLFLAVFIALMSACSSDSGTTAIPNATISDANAQSLAIAGTEGVKQAANSSSFMPLAKTNKPSLVQELTVSLAQHNVHEPAQAANPNFCETGSVTGFDTLSENGGTITYNECVLGGATINGTMIISISTSGDITTSTVIADLTVSYLDKVESFDFSAACTINQTSGATSCTYNSNAPGIDGRTYSVTDISVSGNSVSGFTVSATITDPDNGNITISTTTPVTLNCPDGQPDSGEIVVSDGTNSMTVTYIDCDNYSINFNGSTTTYTW
jgi:hypothetical protein